MLKQLSSALLMGLLVACASNQPKPDGDVDEAQAQVDDAEEQLAEAHAEAAEAHAEAAEDHAEMAEEHAEMAEAMAGIETDIGMLYGEAFVAGEAVAIGTVVASPDMYKDKPILVEGQIRQVCQAMGCWFELATGAEANMGVRVTSKEHNVFIPKDSAGKTATIMGTLEVREVSEEEAEHYRSEGAEAKAGKELTLYMTGVALR